MAFSGIPLPKVVADVGPGGPLVTGLNALNDYELNKIKAQYAPLTTQAEAASKLAYANLMGPQFLAKLMGNPDIVASMKNPQQMVQLLQQAGTGQGTGYNAVSNPALAGLLNPQSPVERTVNAVKRAFGFGGQQPQANVLMSQPAMGNIPSGQNAMSIQGNQGAEIPGMGANAGMAFDRNENNFVASPEEIDAAINRNTNPNEQFAEQAGKMAGIKAEKAESGKLRAKDIQDLNDVYFNAQTKQTTLDDINGMLASPEIREIRQLPLAGRHEMGYYAKFGTPAQQQLVGRLYAQMGNIVKDSSRDFAGQFRRGEQQLLQGMKPNDSDTVDTMIGKAESLSAMNQMLAQRARLTSQYMSQYNINKLEASELADKQFNGEKIRRDIHNRLNPKPSDADRKHMMEKYNIDEKELDKRLKAKGIL